tara:strand:- start:2720 stop:3271 length:552 start_codon:yes stop_codon:yes gene_type:complete
MKPKIKTCKNKDCTNKFEQFNSLISWCSSKCGYELSQQRLKDKESKEWKVRKKHGREQLKTLGQYEMDAKKSYQKWVRLRDKDLACISCNEFVKDLWDGGHYFKAELFSGLIFDERNCHKQCRKCNRYDGGNEIQYRLGLVKRFGQEFVNDLESDSVAKRVYKFTKKELIAIKLKYDIKIKEL